MSVWIQHQTVDCGASVEVDLVVWEAGAVIICPSCNTPIPTHLEFTNNATASKESARQAEIDAVALAQQKKQAYITKVATNKAQNIKPPKLKTISEILNIPLPEEGS